MKKKLYAIGLAAVLLLSGCGGDSGANGGTEAGNIADMPAASAPSAPMETEVLPDYGGWEGGDIMPAPEYGGDSGGSAAIYQNPDAKLIRRAEMEIQTEQFDESVKALNQLAADCGGYFETASVYGGSRRDAYASRRGEYVVRVPAEQYSRFFQSAGNLGYITSSTESSQDVGEKYYDTEARLKTQRTKQERLLVLLEQAESMEDIIALESALSEVEYQIELYSSDLRRYDGLVNFSTFNIVLYEVGRVTEEIGETASLGQRMAAGFQSSVRGLGQGIQNLLIWGSYHVFLLVVLAAAAAVAGVVGGRELKKLKKQQEKKEDKTE